MALEDENAIDAAGIEKATGSIFLTIADAWDWQDEQEHLKALQQKFNSYLRFIDTGELLDTFPVAAFRPVIIDLISRFPLSTGGNEFLKHVAEVCEQHGVSVRHKVYPADDGRSDGFTPPSDPACGG
jgi:hypothetical protein